LAKFELKTSDGEAMKVHKVVLATRSPVFFAMLNNDMQEAEKGIANVPDFDSKLMKEVLRFIYCNEVEDLNEIAHDLVFAAEKYQLDGLKDMFIDSMISTLTTENVLKILLISERVSESKKLFFKCSDLIDE
jgi:hypothetical protein